MNDALTDNDLRLVPTSGSEEFTGFGIELDGQRVGTVALKAEGAHQASLRWNVADDAKGVTIRALRLVVDHGFASLGLHRIEALVDIDDKTNVRNASITGLRREGVVRGHGSQSDRVLLARLSDDPAPFSREGFIAILNAGLPTKRVISQGLLRDEQGRVLLCQLTYKSEWDLPGGVVEVGEAPGIGLVREIHEELGIDVEVKGLITVNWLPAWREWDDACIFLFDLGTIDASITDSMTLQPTEIKGVHWCDDRAVADNATSATIELLTAIAADQVTPYREAPLAD